MQVQRVCHNTLPWLISFSLGLMRKVLLGLLATILAAMLITAALVAQNYRAACSAADKYMATATDGPWERSKVRLGLYAFEGPEVRPFSLLWAFRFRRTGTSEMSKRIYTTFSGDRAWSIRITLDPVPLIGSMP